MKNKKMFVVFLLLFSAYQSYAQVETNYFTKKDTVHSIFKYSRKNSVVKTMPAFDVEKMLKENVEMEDADAPYRFGKGFDLAE